MLVCLLPAEVVKMLSVKMIDLQAAKVIGQQTYLACHCLLTGCYIEP